MWMCEVCGGVNEYGCVGVLCCCSVMSVRMVVVVTDMHVAGFRGSESELCCCTQACLKCWNFTDM